MSKKDKTILLVAFIVFMIMSLVYCKNSEKHFEFGFPFVWLKFYHLGQQIKAIDFFKLYKYALKLDILLVDLLLYFYAVKLIDKLFNGNRSGISNM